jgi:FkbM family methyltransferase
MKLIETLNYKIEVKSQYAYKFLKFCEIDFKGSTTIFFIIMKLFFKNSFTFNINGNRVTWQIQTLSDFRLLRGDYDGIKKKYSLNFGYEGVDLMYIKTLLKPGDIVLDLGANKGFYTLFFSSFVGLTGKVLSFEATNVNFLTLIYRVKTLWNLINVLPFNFILGENNTTLVSMTKPNIFDDGTGFYSKKSTNIGIANSYTRKLDTLINPLNFDSIKLIKIDVEGAEYSVLTGSVEMLKKAEYILVEVSNTGVDRFGHSLENLYTFLESNNFLNSYLINLNKNNDVELLNSNRSVGNILFSKTKLI